MKKRNLALAVVGGVAGGVAAAVTLKLVTRAKGLDWDSAAPFVPHSDRSNFVNVNGARVHYQEFGDAANPPMILIHGFTASVYVWSMAAPKLADAGFYVIAVDLLGFGYSEKPAAFDYSIGSHARMISHFMDTLGIGRATIVGSSYGGAIAATIALDYPARVEKLVLVDAVINDDVKNHPILRLASIPGLGEVITPFLVDSKVLLKARMKNTLAPANHHIITTERVANVSRPLHAADAHRSVLATSRNWDAKRIEKDAHLINHSTLLVWGDQDKVIPIENGYKLYGSIVNSRLVVLKDCGHVPQEEKSDLFAALVAEFCHDERGRVNQAEADGVSLTGV